MSETCATVRPTTRGRLAGSAPLRVKTEYAAIPASRLDPSELPGERSPSPLTMAVEPVRPSPDRQGEKPGIELDLVAVDGAVFSASPDRYSVVPSPHERIVLAGSNLMVIVVDGVEVERSHADRDEPEQIGPAGDRGPLRPALRERSVPTDTSFASGHVTWVNSELFWTSFQAFSTEHGSSVDTSTFISLPPSGGQNRAPQTRCVPLPLVAVVFTHLPGSSQ